MNQKNDNWFDKTFTVLADILLKTIPATKDEKQAFSYYLYGMLAQSKGDYANALENYCAGLKLEEDGYDRSYILYNIGLIYSNTIEYSTDSKKKIESGINNLKGAIKSKDYSAMKKSHINLEKLLKSVESVFSNVNNVIDVDVNNS